MGASHSKPSGDIDKTPVSLAIDPSKPAAVFLTASAGIFACSPDVDPAQIQYNLKNLARCLGSCGHAVEYGAADGNG